SPDGSRIVFSRKPTLASTTSSIWSMSASGSGQTQLTAGTSADARPTYSPDGTTIAFQSDRVGPVQIFSMTTSGQNVTRLTNTSTDATAPAYSPDGQRILFANATSGIFWIPYTGGSALALTSGNDATPDEQAALQAGTP